MAMLPKKVLGAKPLDPAMCFDLWLELGTLQKAADQLTKAGYTSRISGDEISPNAVRIAAYRWMYANLQEAYKHCVEHKTPLSWDEFRVFAFHRYIGTASRSNENVRQWLIDNDFYDPTGEKGFRRFYERKFGRIHSD